MSRRSFAFGVIAGLMLWTSVASAQTAPAAAQTASQSSTPDWQFDLVPYLWGLSIDGDVGGGGSDLTYQLVGTVGMDIGVRYAVIFAYRHLNVDYDKDRVLLDTAIQGPLFGFTFKL